MNAINNKLMHFNWRGFKIQEPGNHGVHMFSFSSMRTHLESLSRFKIISKI